MPTRHDLDETPSTHALAVAAACDGAPHGEAWTALAQTAGRGRLGRGWRSPSGLPNIALSVVVRPPWTTRDLPQTPLLAPAGAKSLRKAKAHSER